MFFYIPFLPLLLAAILATICRFALFLPKALGSLWVESLNIKEDDEKNSKTLLIQIGTDFVYTFLVCWGAFLLFNWYGFLSLILLALILIAQGMLSLSIAKSLNKYTALIIFSREFLTIFWVACVIFFFVD